MRWLQVVACWLLCVPLVVGQSAPKRRAVNLPGREANLAGLPFSDAVVVGDTMYLSGRIGLDPKTGRPPADLEQEIRLALDGMKAVLATEGLTMDDLVQVQVFCPDITLFNRFNAVYKTYFKGDLPARAFLGSGPLLFGGHFEVMGTARKTSK
jgi:enamine deaminase RidA (YjgF/YER057c/UK114 family)